ncbi:hypothetical protein HXX76_010532 [Chlamydomonas incerta]|uniref:Uncharacterized protein n=1 Tax=Chlamydomonas incerta TaxID=51695 RepID=A0A835VXR0_CHLIN|nr:hypothetical protein HXX76_010532 [Chlamydomonas incerta]|eukprot:KAG2429748.1 hypothetical protein HXX76_010532 [Chlamydomonas incerta]
MAHQTELSGSGHRIWPQLPPELSERVAGHLPANVVATCLRLVNRAAAAQFRAARHRTIRLSQPCPHAAFAAHWSRPEAWEPLTLAQRRQLLCLVAASGDLVNLQLAFEGAGCLLTPEVFAAAAGAGRVGTGSTCAWLLRRGCPWGGDVVVAAARAGQVAAAAWLHAAGCPWGWGHAAMVAAEAGHRGVLRWLMTVGGGNNLGSSVSGVVQGAAAEGGLEEALAAADEAAATAAAAAVAEVPLPPLSSRPALHYRLPTAAARGGHEGVALWLLRLLWQQEDEEVRQAAAAVAAEAAQQHLQLAGHADAAGEPGGLMQLQPRPQPLPVSLPRWRHADSLRLVGAAKVLTGAAHGLPLPGLLRLLAAMQQHLLEPVPPAAEAAAEAAAAAGDDNGEADVDSGAGGGRSAGASVPVPATHQQHQHQQWHQQDEPPPSPARLLAQLSDSAHAGLVAAAAGSPTPCWLAKVDLLLQHGRDWDVGSGDSGDSGGEDVPGPAAAGAAEGGAGHGGACGGGGGGGRGQPQRRTHGGPRWPRLHDILSQQPHSLGPAAAAAAQLGSSAARAARTALAGERAAALATAPSLSAASGPSSAAAAAAAATPPALDREVAARLAALRRRGFPLSAPSAAEWLAREGAEAALGYLLAEAAVRPGEEAALFAAQGGRLGALRLLRSSGCPVPAGDAAMEAARAGHLHVLQWLAALDRQDGGYQGGKDGGATPAAALADGAAAWASAAPPSMPGGASPPDQQQRRQRHPVFNEDVLLAAAQSGRLEAVEWVLRQLRQTAAACGGGEGGRGGGAAYDPARLLSAAAGSGCGALLRVLVEHGHVDVPTGGGGGGGGGGSSSGGGGEGGGGGRCCCRGAAAFTRAAMKGDLGTLRALRRLGVPLLAAAAGGGDGGGSSSRSGSGSGSLAESGAVSLLTGAVRCPLECLRWFVEAGGVALAAADWAALEQVAVRARAPPEVLAWIMRQGQGEEQRLP